MAILDADKEGYLRSHVSLIQTIGRAARNVSGRAILYADHKTKSISNAIEETSRRIKQINYNKKNNITPTSTFRKIEESIVDEKSNDNRKKLNKESIEEMRKKMLAYAEDLNLKKLQN